METYRIDNTTAQKPITHDLERSHERVQSLAGPGIIGSRESFVIEPAE
jgi:hypothetical protein